MAPDCWRQRVVGASTPGEALGRRLARGRKLADEMSRAVVGMHKGEIFDIR
jgi:hypothetical protein